MLNPISTSLQNRTLKNIIFSFFSSSVFNNSASQAGRQEFYAPLYIPFPERSLLDILSESKKQFCNVVFAEVGFYVRLCICLAKYKLYRHSGRRANSKPAKSAIKLKTVFIV